MKVELENHKKTHSLSVKMIEEKPVAKKRKPLTKEVINDIRALSLMIILLILMIFYNPVSFNQWLSKNAKFEIKGLENLQSLFPKHRENITDTARFIRNEEWEGVKTGRTLTLNDMYALKLADAGLVLETDGTIITQEELNSRLEAPYTFLIIGSSSMMEGLGPKLEYELSLLENMTVYRHGKYSSGLNRTDFYNWNLAVAQDIAKYQPQAIIAQFGGNDGQDIEVNGVDIRYGTAAWDKAYAQRIHDFARSISGVKKVYWVEIPISAKDSYSDMMRRINRIQREVLAQYPGFIYVESWETFAPDGYYVATLKNRDGVSGVVKASDGIHLSKFGAGIMVDVIFDYVLPDLK